MKKHHGYSGEGLNINNASSANHKSNIKKHNDAKNKRISLE